MENFENPESYEEFTLPEKWVIELNSRVKQWIREEFKTNYYDDKKNHFFHFPNLENGIGFFERNHTSSIMRKGYTKITPEQFELFLKTRKMNKEIKAFKLIKKYPGCNKPLGYVEPYTTGEFLEYPEFWEPIYRESEKTIVVGDKKIKVVIGKKRIIVDEMKVDIALFKNILWEMGRIKTLHQHQSPWPLHYPMIKIGCTLLSEDEIELIIKTYEMFN